MTRYYATKVPHTDPRYEEPGTVFITPETHGRRYQFAVLRQPLHDVLLELALRRLNGPFLKAKHDFAVSETTGRPVMGVDYRRNPGLWKERQAMASLSFEDYKQKCTDEVKADFAARKAAGAFDQWEPWRWATNKAKAAHQARRAVGNGTGPAAHIAVIQPAFEIALEQIVEADLETGIGMIEMEKTDA